MRPNQRTQMRHERGSRFWEQKARRVPAGSDPPIAIPASGANNQSDSSATTTPDTDRALAELGRKRAYGQIGQHEYTAQRAILLAQPTLISVAAARDLGRLPQDQIERLRHALGSIGADAPGSEVRAVDGHPPWLQQRVGDWRILYRPSRDAEPPGSWIVARVVSGGDLDAACSRL